LHLTRKRVKGKLDPIWEVRHEMARAKAKR
jgi:hypothetical protein